MPVDEILEKLVDGVKVEAIFTTRDNVDGDAPDWSEPIAVTLLVQRRQKELKYRGRIYPAGELCGLTVKDFGWAEYAGDQYCGEGRFLAEEYRMKILRILD